MKVFFAALLLSCVYAVNTYAQEQTFEVVFVDENAKEKQSETDQLPIHFENGTLSFEVNADKAEKEVDYILENDKCKECFNEMNEEWFAEFMLLQERGYSLEEADGLACTSAAFVYKLCNVSTLAMMH